MRTVGVEEELLLVDAFTGQARSSADDVLVLDKATTDTLANRPWRSVQPMSAGDPRTRC